MGKPIDEAIKIYTSNAFYEKSDGNLQGYLEFKQLAEWLEQYQELKEQYEARLKADIVAILTELKNKLIDKSWNIDMYDDDLDFECCYLTDIDEIIQQRINELKENNE